MNDTGAVRDRESVGHLGHQLRQAAGLAVRAHPDRERLALDQLHGQELNAVRRAGVVHRNNGRMIQRRRSLRFADEPRHALALTIRWKNFQRDETAQGRIAGGVDLSHAAGAKE